MHVITLAMLTMPATGPAAASTVQNHKPGEEPQRLNKTEHLGWYGAKGQPDHPLHHSLSSK